MNMLTEVGRRTHKQSKMFSIEKIPGITVLENTISELKSSMDVMPDVQIPEQEERRPPRQCNSQKGKFIADSSQGSCSIQCSGAGSENLEPKLLHKFVGWEHAVGSWVKWIGYKFAKQFHWSKLSHARNFPGGFLPIPNWQTVVSVKLIGCIQGTW